MASMEPTLFHTNSLLSTFKYLPRENFQIQLKPKLNPKLRAAATYLPKENPKKPQGEDAHFIYTTEKTIGVADGVGGWTMKGIDAGQYARDLMKNCVFAVLREPEGDVNPLRVLHRAYSNTKVEGTSTACIISLSGDILRAANVGDSRFLIFRDGKTIYQSPVQQRGFNCPYQLGIKDDSPNIADEFKVQVEIGDVVVLGTDGLFDNMEVVEIEEEILRKENCVGINIEPEEMASRIANLALYNSFDRYSETPFSRKSKEAGQAHRGGKIDDITVIAARIC